MPAAQSTIPDYYVKDGDVNALVTDATLTVPSWATTAALRLRSKDATSGNTSHTGSVAGSPPDTVSVEIDTTVTTLGPGKYDAEWYVTDGGTKTMRLPANKYLLLEVVDKL